MPGKTALPNAPLASVYDLADSDAMAPRVPTVYKAKGESLDADLYITLREHPQALLESVETEGVGIGCVTATQAWDLLSVAVPHNSLKKHRPALLAMGIKGSEHLGSVGNAHAGGIGQHGDSRQQSRSATAVMGTSIKPLWTPDDTSSSHQDRYCC